MSTKTVSVSLPGEVIYVSGTVNEVAYTWTLVGEAWQAVVERAADEKYVIVLTAVNAIGTSETYELTLYYGILHLITDRTAAEVARVQTLAAKNYVTMTDAEKAEWDADMKGAYNASDLNRVGAAVAYLAERFAEQGYAVTVSPKTDWLVEDIPAHGAMETYLGNVAALRSLLTVKPSTPATPESMAGLTWQAANDIEQILKDLDELLTNAQRARYYSGELYAGEI